MYNDITLWNIKLAFDSLGYINYGLSGIRIQVSDQHDHYYIAWLELINQYQIDLTIPCTATCITVKKKSKHHVHMSLNADIKSSNCWKYAQSVSLIDITR